MVPVVGQEEVLHNHHQTDPQRLELEEALHNLRMDHWQEVQLVLELVGLEVVLHNHHQMDQQQVVLHRLVEPGVVLHMQQMDLLQVQPVEEVGHMGYFVAEIQQEHLH